MINDLMAGMTRLRSLPDWLLAPLQSEKIIDALRLYVPEITSGEWSIQSCRIKRFFLKDDSGHWEGTYDLTARSARTGLEQKILLHGTLTAPWFEQTGLIESGSGSFGSPNWRCFLPELCLMLRTQEPEKELAAWLVVKFLGEAKQTTKWALATGYLPVRQSAKADVIAGFKADKTWGPVADSYAKMFDWFGFAKVESFFNLGDGSIYASGANGSLYRIDCENFIFCDRMSGLEYGLADLSRAEHSQCIVRLDTCPF